MRKPEIERSTNTLAQAREYARWQFLCSGNRGAVWAGCSTLEWRAGTPPAAAGRPFAALRASPSRVETQREPSPRSERAGCRRPACAEWLFDAGSSLAFFNSALSRRRSETSLPPSSTVQKALVQGTVPACILPVCKLRLDIVVWSPPPESERNRIINRTVSPVQQPAPV